MGDLLMRKSGFLERFQLTFPGFWLRIRGASAPACSDVIPDIANVDLRLKALKPLLGAHDCTLGRWSLLQHVLLQGRILSSQRASHSCSEKSKSKEASNVSGGDMASVLS